MVSGSSPPYRLVVFDFDGTLVDSLPWLYSVLDEVSERFELRRLEPAELEGLRNLDGRSILDRLGVPLWKVPVVAAHVRALARRDIGRLAPFEGVPPMLRALADHGLELGVVSSNAADTIRRVLGTDSALVRHYECGASMFGKPSKLRKVLKRSGVPAHEAIYLGDEVRDAEAARAVGMAFGAVAWGYNTIEVLRQQAPAEVFGTVGELVASLTRESAGTDRAHRAAPAG